MLHKLVGTILIEIVAELCRLVRVSRSVTLTPEFVVCNCAVADETFLERYSESG